MNKERDLALKEEFPIILQELGGEPSETCMSWEHDGIAIGNGWIPILRKLLNFLQFNTDKNGYPQIIAEQIKEKFGGLCFYYRIEYSKADQKDEKFLEGAISFAESLSYTICEDCGAPGTKTKGGWIQTLCEDCG